ncbi:hypothetical protein SY87_30330 [Burkholderia pseudomallei]|uniref:hypothetical protein n=1 Tax=Burkholderia pseudomallei TaxID=28450 RepID=UPI0005CA116A|nr:hypothetical protein [Burkholderia pseudomallei]KIX39900.1 hypothetical protein SY87_30330 [Burkholderia pseudomallei]
MAAEAEDEARDEAEDEAGAEAEDEAEDEAATADEATRVGVAAGGSVVEAGAPAALAAAVAADATVAVSAAAAGAGRPVAAQTNSRAATKPGTRKPARAEEASTVIIVALVWSD